MASKTEFHEDIERFAVAQKHLIYKLEALAKEMEEKFDIGDDLFLLHLHQYIHRQHFAMTTVMITKDVEEDGGKL